MTPFSIPAKKILRCIFGENLVTVTQIHILSKLLHGQAEFPRILSQNGQNVLEDQGQWPPFSTPADSISGGLYSLSRRTSYRKILWSLKAARFRLRLFQSLRNLTGTSTGALLLCLSKFQSYTIITTSNLAASRHHEISFGAKTFIHLVNRGPGHDGCMFGTNLVIVLVAQMCDALPCIEGKVYWSTGRQMQATRRTAPCSPTWNLKQSTTWFSKSDIRALPVSNLSAAPLMHGCIPVRGGL